MIKQKSWGIIIIWIIIFWPVGVYFLFKRLNTDKSALMTGNPNILIAVGYILILFAILGFFSNINHIETAFFSLIIYGAGAYLVLKKASKTKLKAKKYKAYLDLIINQGIIDSNEIGNRLEISNSSVNNDIQEMITAGYLPNNYNIPLEPIYHNNNIQQEKVVKCPACGANNKITVGKVSECEYCGTQIH
ncbi:hypothetical protein [Lactococcus protaetiae]|uniref:Uncharacterized protein n=1 Tax=Lactococcus protaetiae TaxID=2592653 RepID=A0A514Z6J2_9LACT|nr:hypothetical protein [Lactococcus protaetiae]QDK70196.1 hypothetical protein FLP15_02115 [Lactococcus protaetiae]